MDAKSEIQQLQKENQRLRQEVEHLRNEMIRLIERNLDLSDQLEGNVEFHRRALVAKELLDGNIMRQRNADLQDDAQLMAILELRIEKGQHHLDPNFDAEAMAQIMGVSKERLARLFRHQSMFRSADAYLDNLRLMTALRLLREKSQYNIAAIAREAGFNNVRTFQRRIQEIIGMTPAEYRALLTRDL